MHFKERICNKCTEKYTLLSKYIFFVANKERLDNGLFFYTSPHSLMGISFVIYQLSTLGTIVNFD